MVLENNCQFTGFLVSELSSCAWSIPHLIGLVERQNLSLPNEVKDLRYLLSQCFCAISVQLYHLIPAIFIYLPGNLNLELGCKEAWRIHTCGDSSDGGQVYCQGRSGKGVSGGFL